jgi:hypothetical protein
MAYWKEDWIDVLIVLSHNLNPQKKPIGSASSSAFCNENPALQTIN